MYKNYFFDLYGTLVDIRTDERKPSLWRGAAEFIIKNENKNRTKIRDAVIVRTSIFWSWGMGLWHLAL